MVRQRAGIRRDRVAIVLACALLGSSGIGAQNANRWLSHVRTLADDAMKGRNTGSPEHARAAEYVARQFALAGLDAAGTKGYLQPVRFETRTIDESRSSLTLVHEKGRETLRLGTDANINVRNDPASTVDAPLVFAGYGFRVPEAEYDDLAGLDLNGAVVVYLAGSPRGIPGALRAHYQSAGERWSALKAKGAIGTIGIPNPTAMEIPWERSTGARLQPAMTLADAALNDTPGQQLSVTMNPAQAERLFADSGHSFKELVDLANMSQPLPRFKLPARVTATVAVERGSLESDNVAGILRGSDPARRNEYVVISAHLDHMGVGEPINGDSIYNGAMDNASGIAAILEIAQQMRDRDERPARSLLFLAVTGEEKGTLGSRYFAAHPTVPPRALVADVNIDMFLPLFPLRELMVLGLDESDLGRDIREVAKGLQIGVQADPEPERNRFIRSDQYSFIRAGIPALSMKVGYELNSPEAEIARKWTNERYHAPSDDLDQPMDLPAAEKYVEILRLLSIRIANRPDRPAWNDTSFFKRFAK